MAVPLVFFLMNSAQALKAQPKWPEKPDGDGNNNTSLGNACQNLHLNSTLFILEYKQ